MVRALLCQPSGPDLKIVMNIQSIVEVNKIQFVFSMMSEVDLSGLV